MSLDPASEAAYAWRDCPGSAEAKEVIAALTEVARAGAVSRRGWAAVALGEFGPDAEGAVPVLIKVIERCHPQLTFEREASAAKALGKIAPDTPSADKAIAALLPLLDSKRPLSQSSAIEALGRFGPKAAAAIPRIRALKEDRDRDVREAATKASGRDRDSDREVSWWASQSARPTLRTTDAAGARGELSGRVGRAPARPTGWMFPKRQERSRG